jgi:uncharacterized membrane protein
MTTHPLLILCILCLIVAFCEWLARQPYFRQLGTALLVILLTALLANMGVLPSSSGPSEVYDGIFTYVAPISIFFLMLGVNLKSVRRAGPTMIGLFLAGAVGTLVGVALAFGLLDLKAILGEKYFAIGGMLTGTYIGGSMNFNAVALTYSVAREGTLYAATTAADNIITAIWIVATLAMPALLNRWLGRRAAPVPQRKQKSTLPTDDFDDQETVEPRDLGILLALALGAVYVSGLVTRQFPFIPSILTITTLALLLAQLPAIERLRGSRVLGMFLIYLFLAVIGAYCDIPALIQDGQVALWLLAVITFVVLVHAVFIVAVGWYFKLEWVLVAVASQANIGGSSSALALARSLGRPDLQLPAILIGTLGNALGTYAGFIIAEWLR